jgi:hypothetical protein
MARRLRGPASVKTLHKSVDPETGVGLKRVKEQLRNNLREVLEVALQEVVHRMHGYEDPDLFKQFLNNLTKDELVDWVLQRPAMHMEWRDLIQLIDKTARYGVGVVNVMTGDDQGGPIKHGVVIMPGLAKPGENLGAHMIEGRERAKLQAKNAELKKLPSLREDNGEEGPPDEN